MTHLFRLWVGALCISLAPVFVKLVSDLSPTLIGFYRCLFAAFLLLPILALAKQAPEGLNGHRLPLLKLSMLIGAVFAVDLWCWHRSVVYAGAGLSTLLANTQVFYLGVAGVVLYGEPMRRQLWVAIGLAFLGIAVLIDPGSTVVSPQYWTGIALGLMAGLAYATYLTLMRKLESLPVTLPTSYRLALVSVSSSVALLAISFFEGPVRLPVGMDWLWLVGLAAVAQVMGWLLITRSLPHVSVSLVGLILLTQPVGATLWGALLFNEPFEGRQIIGTLITLLAIYLGTLKSKPSSHTTQS